MSKYLSIDTAAGVKHLINKGFVHEDKIGAWAGPGGYFTGLMLAKNAELFDVGVSVAPVMDLDYMILFILKDQWDFLKTMKLVMIQLLF